jgi:hypothetical protein
MLKARAFSQLASVARRSGSLMSAPCSVMSSPTLYRPRRTARTRWRASARERRAGPASRRGPWVTLSMMTNARMARAAPERHKQMAEPEPPAARACRGPPLGASRGRKTGSRPALRSDSLERPADFAANGAQRRCHDLDVKRWLGDVLLGLDDKDRPGRGDAVHRLSTGGPSFRLPPSFVRRSAPVFTSSTL